jgi:dipeptidyl aminopeptidase/acylaminoacyl peptidase
MSRGRRIRRRRQAGAVAAAFVAVAAIAAPYVWLRPDPKPPGYPVAGASGPSATTLPTAGPGSTAVPSAAPPGRPRSTSWNNWQNAPLVLPGGWTVVSATTSGTPVSNWAYDRKRGRYVDTSKEFTSVWAAPRGSLAAVRRDGHSGETGLLDVVTGEVRWVSTPNAILAPQWSPDGSRLLLTSSDKQTGNRSFGILTVESDSYREYPVRSDRYECTDLCQFTWMPTGKEVALPLTDPTAPRSESAPHLRLGLQLFAAADGRPTRLLPVRGNVSDVSAWSPDGQLVVVAGQQGAQLVSVGKGAVVRALPAADVTWVDDKRLLYVAGRLNRDTHFVDVEAVLIDRSGTELERAELPGDLAGTDILIAPR